MVSPDIQTAARMLESGLLVAFPTETVYGLGGDAENPQAVAAIYALKKRPADHPLIVHVAPETDISRWVRAVPPEASRLMAAFWPGPLTLILKKTPGVLDAASGGQDAIALRCPAHPVAQALLRAFKQGKGGVAAPSANRFGHVSPTTAAHVYDEFGDDTRLAAVLDGGACPVGIESTILDMSRLAEKGPVVLRPGKIRSADIARVIGVLPSQPDSYAPRASGTLPSHYAPRIPVSLAATARLHPLLAALAAKKRKVALLHFSPISAQEKAALEKDIAFAFRPESYANGLYAALRDLDHTGADIILVEAIPDTDDWRGVYDRLSRASFHGRNLAEAWAKE